MQEQPYNRTSSLPLFLSSSLSLQRMHSVDEHLMQKDSSLMGQLPLAALFGSFLFWSNFYLYLCIFNRRCSPECNCRIVTAFHGIVATLLTFISAFITGPFPFTYVGKPNTQFHVAIIVISIGYFMFDFAWSLWYQTEGLVMLAHHIVSIFGFSYVLYTGMSGCELTAVLGGSEVSNPFLQLRWFMRYSGHYSGRPALLVDWAFVSIFLGVRLGLGTALHFRVQLDPSVYIPAKLGGQAFYIISCMFGFQIVRFVYRKYWLKRPGKDD